MTTLYPGLEDAASVGGPNQTLTEGQIREFVLDQLGGYDFDGRRVTLVVPDGTRHAPVAQVAKLIHEALGSRPVGVRVVIALGTHDYMDDEAIAKLMGCQPGRFEETYPGWTITNHDWRNETTFTNLGTIPAERIAELTEGRLTDRPMTVLVNSLVVDTDISLVLGPVLPHEVVGISGGNKYFFPGLSGHDVIDMSHWVGALITSYEMIGSVGITPVRQMIDAAAELIPSTKLLLGMIVKPGTNDLEFLSFGDTRSSWEACAEVSSQVHVKYVPGPYKRVLSMIPPMYEDMWTGAKGFYKLEPVVADGGELIIYAPHITQVSVMHPGIEEIGYHNRQYFVGQWDRFKDHPWGELAHSTHLRGLGDYDPQTGEETHRVTVTLATGIPREVVEKINLRYLDPAEVDIAALMDDPDTLVVPNAGELLHRTDDQRGRLPA
ncbi:lactate racemase domain-containing protein [Aestuariimicrobium sp. p3-SID1156]|uniref:lactate racemase domain-containing protein n=1 Tax=Aestuariimicrobium sp. p3-SID1156 TaxID=2916038 RepID=UPI00223B992D|nr:lactate racemase domain-containing protein [Aestuariimicrobium sp. p3-SID1156]MCT1460073.1 lactate racemase domain-containing protein [Aestuariimicrobium sp. p3-SID1156]